MRSCFLLLLLGGCYASAPPPSAPIAPIDIRPFEVDANVAETSGLACAEDRLTEPSPRYVEDELETLPHLTGTEQLAFAKRALRCSSPVAALVVYRIVPELLLRTIDGEELNRAYAFLNNDRAHALALFRTLIENHAPQLEVGLPEDRPSISEPSELARLFRPEKQIGATCADLDDLTPYYGAQVAFAIEVLKRDHCDALVAPMLSRAMRSASGARAEACEHADASMRDEVAAAASSDPGVPIYEVTNPTFPRVNIVTLIYAILLAPLATQSSVARVDYPGRDHCTWALERLTPPSPRPQL